MDHPDHFIEREGAAARFRMPILDFPQKLPCAASNRFAAEACIDEDP